MSKPTSAELTTLSIAEAGVRAATEFDDATGAPIESHAVQLSAPSVEELELWLKL